MYSRKNENPEMELYEVTYYDVKQGMDPEIRSFVEYQVKSAIESCKARIRDLDWKNRMKDVEIDNLQKTIAVLVSK
jgi:hypothetical protein